MGSFGTPGGGPSCKQTSPRFHFLGCALGFSGIEAREVYYHFMRMGFEDDIPKKNVIVPNSAIVLLGKSVRVDEVVSVAVLSAYAHLKLVLDLVIRIGCCLDLISWNSVVSEYIKCGLVEMARQLFDKMLEKDVVCFLTEEWAEVETISLVEWSLEMFEAMRKCPVVPNIITFVAGCLKEAAELIGTMPMTPDVASWSTLLGACNKHGDKD
ncbi:hypothetical protein Pfo_005130 [Paulownia fortunei]|nr:hypothetical protein Pfo_005130 [Paulownia fortunei]